MVRSVSPMLTLLKKKKIFFYNSEKEMDRIGKAEETVLTSIEHLFHVAFIGTRIEFLRNKIKLIGSLEILKLLKK